MAVAPKTYTIGAKTVTVACVRASLLPLTYTVTASVNGTTTSVQDTLEVADDQGGFNNTTLQQIQRVFDDFRQNIANYAAKVDNADTVEAQIT
jgi:hypothetical protein